jgi:hypothetical protein
LPALFRHETEKICGLAFSGMIVAVEQDRVRVDLEMGGLQPENSAYWFEYATPYAAEGNTGVCRNWVIR